MFALIDSCCDGQKVLFPMHQSQPTTRVCILTKNNFPATPQKNVTSQSILSHSHQNHQVSRIHPKPNLSSIASFLIPHPSNSPTQTLSFPSLPTTNTIPTIPHHPSPSHNKIQSRSTKKHTTILIAHEVRPALPHRSHNR